MSGGNHSSVWAIGYRAVRLNLWPAVCLQLVAGAILLSHQHPDGAAFFADLADLRSRVGWRFAVISTPLFAAVLPYLLEPLRRGGLPRTPPRVLLALVLFWSLKGLEIDAFYRLQDWLFPASMGGWLVPAKVAVDQLLYVTLWAVPSTIWYYQWARGSGTSQRDGWVAWYRQHVLSVVMLNWLVWIPAVTVIYCLPVPLQLPIQNLVLCLWALLLMFLTTGPDKDE